MRTEGLPRGSDAPLNELDKIEWRDVVRRVRPDITDAEFDWLWGGFQEMKRRKEQN